MNRRTIQSAAGGIVAVLVLAGLGVLAGPAGAQTSILRDLDRLLDLGSLTDDIDAAVEVEIARLERRAELEDEIEDLRDDCADERADLRDSARGERSAEARAATSAALAGVDERCRDALALLTLEARALDDRNTRIRIRDDASLRRIAIAREQIELRNEAEDLDERCSEQADRLQARASSSSRRSSTDARLASLERDCERKAERIDLELEILANERSALENSGVRGVIFVDMFRSLARERLRTFDAITRAEDKVASIEDRCDARRDSMQSQIDRTSSASRATSLAASLLRAEHQCANDLARAEAEVQALETRLNAVAGVDLANLDLSNTLVLEAFT